MSSHSKDRQLKYSENIPRQMIASHNDGLYEEEMYLRSDDENDHNTGFQNQIVLNNYLTNEGQLSHHRIANLSPDDDQVKGQLFKEPGREPFFPNLF